MWTRLVVVGGSAGAVEPLREIVAGLSDPFPAPILVTLHLAPGSHSRLPQVLAGIGPLPVRHPRHGEPLEPGVIFVAPPDRHLVVHEQVAYLSRGPKENRHRPSVDVLFNSAARWHGPGVIGVVLSGALDDGVAGATAIAAQDGTVIVQDPDEARIIAMPTAAARAVRRAQLAPAGDIAGLLDALVDGSAGSSNGPAPDPLVRWESENVDSTDVQARTNVPGSPVALGCPDCGGGMFESVSPGGTPYVTCHVGHSWSPESLMDAQREATESSLYAAAAKLHEESMVLRRLADLRRRTDGEAEAAGLETLASQAENQAQQIESMVRNHH
jgi:two-component system, chemotaxis family, protein-glutamate methylesterase/glutaminase